jgi:thiol-disulfide isomerase/thioredoxin
MKPIFLWAIILLPSFAQSQLVNEKIEPLQIGSKIPDIKLHNILNENNESRSLGQFKGKLVILDFWNTTCLTCVKRFGKIDSLQKQFSDKIQIIAVNKESTEKTQAFFTKRKDLKIPSIPFVTGDTILSKMFPYVFVPHHVWIDQNGIVRFITNEWNLNDKNIREFLTGKELALSEKKYEKVSCIDKPVLSIDNGKYLNTIDYYSFIGRCISGVNIGNRVENTEDNPDHLNRITQNCTTPLILFRIAFSEMGKYNLEARNSIQFEHVDTSDFIEPSVSDYNYDNWQTAHLHNYDLMVPEHKSQDLFKVMQQDVKRYFDVEARIEKRKIKCNVLIRTSKIDKIKTKGEHSSKIHQAMSIDSLFYLHNISVNELTRILSELFAANGVREPFVNGTNYNGKIDIGFRRSMFKPVTPSNLNNYLKAYNLQIVQKIHEINVLVIHPKLENHQKE